MGWLDGIRHVWNIFRNKDPTKSVLDLGPSYGYRPDRIRFSRGNERSIVASVENRIAMDAAAIDIKHVRLDENKRYKETIESDLNNCLTVEANLDQAARSFRQDIYASLLDDGCVAVVPIDTDDEPDDSGTFKIYSMRTARILDWYPHHIRVDVYDENLGKHREAIVPKSIACIVENPLYAVMNEPNSVLQRLSRKLSLLDAVDEQTSSGKLDLIIQLPYTVKSKIRQDQAERRRKDVEQQLAEGKYGIAYIDGTEHVTQLNRPVENNLLKHIEYLTNQLFNQFGFSQAILDGTADEQEMLNYQTRMLEPLVTAVTEEMNRKFLTKTARTQGQKIMFFRDPFKLVPVNNIAEIADKFTRNEIMTSNEVRQVIGMTPSDDPNADVLRNKNLSAPQEDKKMLAPPGRETRGEQPKEVKNQNG